MRSPLFQNQIYVKKSPIHGYGVFAGKDIEPGEIIEECYGLPGFKHNDAFRDYYFTFDDEPWLALGFGSIYNSSAYCNTKRELDINHSVLTVIATRKIKKDEEIFISYGKKWFSSRHIRQKETSWRYHWRKIMPTTMSTLRFIVVSTILYAVIRFKSF